MMSLPTPFSLTRGAPSKLLSIRTFDQGVVPDTSGISDMKGYWKIKQFSERAASLGFTGCESIRNIVP
jgi:hypothetical protein